MPFQLLDDKKHCVGVFTGDTIVYDSIPENLSQTWSYAPALKGRKIDYAQIYCGGRSLDEVCPENIRPHWQSVSKKMKAYLRSFLEAKVSLDEHCFYDLVPENFLYEYCRVKNLITAAVFDAYPKPKNYEFMVKLSEVMGDIGNNDLALNPSALNSERHNTRVRNFWKQIVNMRNPRISYNVFGTKTGRLTTHKKSFPILTMDKDYRKILQPTNDLFVELDFNAAELRTLLALSGKDQPTEDMHNWNIKNIFGGGVTRDEAKKKIFAWLYNPKALNKKAEAVYNRSIVVRSYFNGSQVETVCDRTIPADEEHALNYIIQSTTSDVFLGQLLAVNDYLQDKESRISFCIHDNLVLDIKEKECYIIPHVIKLFGDTPFGEFRVNVRVGKDFGNMKELTNGNNSI